MSTFPIIMRPVDKAGTALIEARREDGHGSTALTPTHVQVTNAIALDAPTLAALENIQVTISNPTTGFATETTLAALLTELQSQQKNALTDAQLRATPVAVSTGLTQPTTPADTQPISATALPLPVGAATSAKQLPDNHQVTANKGTGWVNPQTDALTDIQLRATPVVVQTGLTQPTTPVDTQPISAIALPLPGGAATAAKQLPDNHQVQVSNFPATQTVSGTLVVNKGSSWVDPQTDALTNTQLRASDINVADSGEREYTHLPVTVTASGDTTLYTPAAGNRIRLRWIYAVNEPTSSTSPLIKVFLGAEEKYRVYAISKRQVVTGPVDGALIINLSAASPVAVTVLLEEITP